MINKKHPDFFQEERERWGRAHRTVRSLPPGHHPASGEPSLCSIAMDAGRLRPGISGATPCTLRAESGHPVAWRLIARAMRRVSQGVSCKARQASARQGRAGGHEGGAHRCRQSWGERGDTEEASRGDGPMGDLGTKGDRGAMVGDGAKV